MRSGWLGAGPGWASPGLTGPGRTRACRMVPAGQDLGLGPAPIGHAALPVPSAPRASLEGFGNFRFSGRGLLAARFRNEQREGCCERPGSKFPLVSARRKPQPQPTRPTSLFEQHSRCWMKLRSPPGWHSILVGRAARACLQTWATGHSAVLGAAKPAGRGQTSPGLVPGASHVAPKQATPP